jgi:hypothetical protein
MIDRTERDKVIAAFEEFLDDRITAFDFDERLGAIQSKDHTIHEVINAAWYHYDDCIDHKVVLTKAEWDYFQRLLLILRSDAELSTTDARLWSWDHALAWLALLAFVAISFSVGWGWHLFAWAIPFGILSLLISNYRRDRVPVLEPRRTALIPFGSLSDLRNLRSTVPKFQKRRYRSDIEGRTIRCMTEQSFNLALSRIHYILLGPLVLLFQGFPSIVDHRWELRKP